MKASKLQLSRRATLQYGAVVSTTGLAGCLSQADATDTSEMTLASAFDPGHINVIAAEGFKERIEEETDGEFTVNITAGGAYGSESEISEIVRQGGVEAHAGGSIPYYQYATEYWFFGCPLVVDDYEHLLSITESNLIEEAHELMIDRGNQRPFGQQIYRGERHMTANRPIRGPRDIDGLNLRLPEAHRNIFHSINGFSLQNGQAYSLT